MICLSVLIWFSFLFFYHFIRCVCHRFLFCISSVATFAILFCFCTYFDFHITFGTVNANLFLVSLCYNIERTLTLVELPMPQRKKNTQTVNYVNGKFFFGTLFSMISTQRITATLQQCQIKFNLTSINVSLS